jgi:hypothetical protein
LIRSEAVTAVADKHIFGVGVGVPPVQRGDEVVASIGGLGSITVKVV